MNNLEFSFPRVGMRYLPSQSAIPMRGNRELSQFECYSHAWEWGIFRVQVSFPCVGMGNYRSSSAIPMHGNVGVAEVKLRAIPTYDI